MPISRSLTTAAARRMSKLRPELEAAARGLVADCAALGIEILVTQGYRTHDEQDALYAQGRTTKGPDVSPRRPFGRTVTNAKAGSSAHNFAAAFDFAFVVDGKLSWDESLPWLKVGLLGEARGLVWGGRWRTPDKPHFELPEWKSLPVPTWSAA